MLVQRPMEGLLIGNTFISTIGVGRLGKIMRRFLLVLGALALAGIIAAAVGLGMIVYQGRLLDAESKAFADQVIPAIITSRNMPALLDRLTPEVRDKVKPQELNAVFDGLSRLGPLLDYGGANGEATMTYAIGSGGAVSARYIASARFKNGSATFQIVLQKRDGQWMIHSFHVEPTPGGRN